MEFSQVIEGGIANVGIGQMGETILQSVRNVLERCNFVTK